jgi:hypothetical protein
MRRVVLTLTLLSLAFAPAPFPKAQRPARESEQTRQERLLRECRRRLDELGVKWQVVAGPRGDVVRFRLRMRMPNGTWGMDGERPIEGGDLTGALRWIAERTGEFAQKALAGDRP